MNRPHLKLLGVASLCWLLLSGCDKKEPPAAPASQAASATPTAAAPALPPPNPGAAQLATGWTDPDFKPGERAFYYARVLENPTPRWNTYDAVRQQMAPLTKVPATLRERAWSSPIWYTPS